MVLEIKELQVGTLFNNLRHAFFYVEFLVSLLLYKGVLAGVTGEVR